jgi:C4-dicarboxylate-specific signal transduction histidine kinase
MIANLVLYLEAIVFITALVTLKTRLSPYILMHTLTVIIMILPFYLGANGIAVHESIFKLTDAALVLFPLSAAFIIVPTAKPFQTKQTSSLYILALASLAIYFAAPQCRTENFLLTHTASWIVILYLIYQKKAESVTRVYLLFSSMAIMILLLLFFLNRDITVLATSAGLFSVIFTYTIIFFYMNRIVNATRRFEKIHDMNKKLTHTVSRLKTSNEQIQKIIMQKDIELLQLSRHASLAEITTGIAHELSQPLTGIKGIAQNMIDDINYDEFDKLQAVSELHKISSLVDKSSSIIDHIRNFSKKSLFSMKTIDLNATVLDAIDLINHQLKKNEIDLVFILDENIPRITGNTLSLEQMIVNIILNARDAIIEKKQLTNKSEGRIHVSTTADNQSVILKIEDNGPGIPDDIVKKIWSPFFTTKSKGQGTGIGLSICSRIIREHQGSLELKTNKKGTSFTIRFPVKPAGNRASQ